MVMTTTLSSLSTPSPLATMPMMLSTYETMTTVASKALKTSNRNIRLLANVFKIISAKKRERNTLSIYARKESATPKISATVS